MSLETYWPSYCKRKLEDSGCLYLGPNLVHSFRIPFCTGKDQLRLFLLDSLYCALTHTEPIIAFRAFYQAVEYMCRLDGASDAAHCSPALICARNRIESFLPSRSYIPHAS